MINYNVPFYPNAEDGTHCFQAVLKMILKFWFTEENYSISELDFITNKIQGKWTWSMAGMIWLKKVKGLDVRNIRLFNYEKFAVSGSEYLEQFYGKETAIIQIRNSDIEQEMQYAKIFSREINSETRIPEFKEILELLSLGYLVICSVNSKILNNKVGFTGHFILVIGFTGTSIIAHDPGFPSFKSREIDLDLFNRAWSSPSSDTRSIIAIRKTA